MLMELDPNGLNAFVERRDQAVRAIDALLLRRARNALPALRPNHAARLVAGGCRYAMKTARSCATARMSLRR